MSDAFRDAVIRDTQRERDGLSDQLRLKELELSNLREENERLRLKLSECRRGWREND